ncbi:DNA polymerase alpha catalytic subunit, partial [Reticulomyxa filosa]
GFPSEQSKNRKLSVKERVENWINAVTCTTWLATEIIPDFLWLGDNYDALNYEEMKKRGITYILNCSAEDALNNLQEYYVAKWLEEFKSREIARQDYCRDVMAKYLASTKEGKDQQTLKERAMQAFESTYMTSYHQLLDNYKKKIETLEEFRDGEKNRITAIILKQLKGLPHLEDIEKSVELLQSVVEKESYIYNTQEEAEFSRQEEDSGEKKLGEETPDNYKELKEDDDDDDDDDDNDTLSDDEDEDEDEADAAGKTGGGGAGGGAGGDMNNYLMEEEIKATQKKRKGKKKQEREKRRQEKERKRQEEEKKRAEPMSRASFLHIDLAAKETEIRNEYMSQHSGYFNYLNRFCVSSLIGGGGAGGQQLASLQPTDFLSSPANSVKKYTPKSMKAIRQTHAYKALDKETLMKEFQLAIALLFDHMLQKNKKEYLENIAREIALEKIQKKHLNKHYHKRKKMILMKMGRFLEDENIGNKDGVPKEINEMTLTDLFRNIKNIEEFFPYKIKNIYARNWKSYDIIGLHSEEVISFIQECKANKCKILVFDCKPCKDKKPNEWEDVMNEMEYDIEDEDDKGYEYTEIFDQDDNNSDDEVAGEDGKHSDVADSDSEKSVELDKTSDDGLEVNKVGGDELLLTRRKSVEDEKKKREDTNFEAVQKFSQMWNQSEVVFNPIGIDSKKSERDNDSEIGMRLDQDMDVIRKVLLKNTLSWKEISELYDLYDDLLITFSQCQKTGSVSEETIRWITKKIQMVGGLITKHMGRKYLEKKALHTLWKQKFYSSPNGRIISDESALDRVLKHCFDRSATLVLCYMLYEKRIEEIMQNKETTTRNGVKNKKARKNPKEVLLECYKDMLSKKPNLILNKGFKRQLVQYAHLLKCKQINDQIVKEFKFQMEQIKI